MAATFGGLAGARRGQPLNSIGRAGLAGVSGYAGALDRQRQEAEAALQDELRGLQVQNQKQTLETARKAAEQAERVQGLIQNAAAPIAGTTANAATGITGPRPEAAAAIGQPRQIDFQALAAQGVPFEVLKNLAESANLGRAEVARTQEVEGPNGTKQIVQLDRFGRPVGGGMTGYVAPVQVNQGDKITFARPTPGHSFNVGMSPSERDASARGWASVNQGAQRLALDKQSTHTFSAELGGYVPKAPGGQFIPLDGTQQGGKLTESEGKNTMFLGQMRDASKALSGVDSVSPVEVAATGNPVTNWAAPADAQKAAQAQRQWAEAYLRVKTGAAATAGEVENNIRTFFPVAGDSKEVIAQKAKARAQAEQDLVIAAGRGASRLNQAPAAAPQPAAQWKYENGKLVKVN
jgi:hypothetical protein